MVQKRKKELRVTITLDERDMEALQLGMDRDRETNMSSYIRRLIHEKCRLLPSEIPFNRKP